ncbi:MATH and LRR domain-containing protein PFE0570w [Manduca sexta]|uniref:MATH and LRR domain-containing protein PFE0570w n=1 Tax=Manduca sexta TaxID=7130 RepID=UPI00188E563A|nr:MATH and LRR domain-containing protein PFE0570w [Manduca sexta]XP_030021505.2 MATH and LRR domain-containing protein PFE0570w [Manduca sexta]
MKPASVDKSSKKNGYQSDDDNVRYKLNKEFFNNANKSPAKIKKEKLNDDDNNIRYKFASVVKTKINNKTKPKSKLKVNFWSNKQSSRLSSEAKNPKSNRRHTVGVVGDSVLVGKSKQSGIKVRKRVSFLPSPLFSDNHVPMVTVPDDLTIQLNEEEANDLREDLNSALESNGAGISNNVNNSPKRKSKASNLTSPRGIKRKQSLENSEPRVQINENELEFFTKYVVQKLRRMETNQRIYSENLINTVLMLGQLGKLNGKSKIAEA